MSERGFTLAEVLVALVVFSIAAIGLAHLVTETTAGAGHTRSRALAGIEADNRIVEAVSEPGILQAGTMTGRSTQRGELLEWTRRIDLRGEDGLAGVQVTVTDAVTGQQLVQRETLVWVSQ